jgi:putative FmdB family regulatory protein
MPIYEYKCKNCGERLEVFAFSNNETRIVCPECGSEETERVLSNFAANGSSCGGSSRFR